MEAFMLKYSDIEASFDFVSSGPQYESSAYLHVPTGEIFWSSAYADCENNEEAAKEKGIDVQTDCIQIPHKNELNLGRDLVFEFVEENAPADFERIRSFFHKAGAYARFKDFLENKDLLQKWYDFETVKTEKAIFDWCAENGIEFVDDRKRQ
jgi:hypothetical protein